MSYSIRHEGSPQSIDNLTLAQVVEGLLDGQWEPTDEVKGPQDRDWIAIENHPQLEEIAADLEPPPPKFYDDESRLDMNALIDVCLVLLIFFILITSYATLQKVLDSPDLSSNDPGKLRLVRQVDVKEFMIAVTAKMENGKPVILVEGEAVEPDDLRASFARFVKGASHKRELFLDHEDEVPHGTIVAIQDAAKGAGIDQVHLKVSVEKEGKK